MDQHNRDAGNTAAAHPTQAPQGVSSNIPVRAPVPSGVGFKGKRTSKYMPGTPSDSALTPACGRTVGQARTLQQGPCGALGAAQSSPR